jgi:hypothetical protein
MTTPATGRPQWKDEQTMTGAEPVRLPGAELARLLGNALPFAGTDETLPMLCAVRLRAAGDVLTAEATDRFALIRETFMLTAPAGGLDVAVPLAAVKHLRRLLAGLPRPDRVLPVELTTVSAVTTGSGTTVPALRVATTAGISMEITGAAGFPDTDAVFAKYDAYTAEHDTGPFDVAMNPAMLARLAKIRPAGTHRGSPLRVRLTQPVRPALPPLGRPAPDAPAVHAALDGIRVLVMPMRPDPAESMRRAA